MRQRPRQNRVKSPASGKLRRRIEFRRAAGRQHQGKFLKEQRIVPLGIHDGHSRISEGVLHQRSKPMLTKGGQQGQRLEVLLTFADGLHLKQGEVGRLLRRQFALPILHQGAREAKGGFSRVCEDFGSRP